jgi:hypothetical protein
MGIFGNISSATYSDGGVYLLPGVYRLKIKSCIYKKTRKGQDAFIVEFEVVESTNTERLPGSTCSWMVTMDKEPALGNIKQFIAEAVEQAMEAINEQIAEAVVAAQNPLAGRFVRCSAVNIKTKANRDFTKVKFIRDSAGKAAAEAEQAKG